MSKELAIQDYYTEQSSHCYGCGRLNKDGHHIKTYWDIDTGGTYAVFHPRPYHTGMPGFVYGGLLASLIDCHGTGSASAAMYHSLGESYDAKPGHRFVTGTLSVRFIKPTPLGPPIELRGEIKEIKGRKVTVAIDVVVSGELCVQGEVIAIEII